MHYNKLYCFDNDLESSHKNNTWNLECNVEKLQEILNRIIQKYCDSYMLNNNQQATNYSYVTGSAKTNHVRIQTEIHFIAPAYG